MSILSQARKDLTTTIGNVNDFGVAVAFSRLGNTYNWVCQVNETDLNYDEAGQPIEASKVTCVVIMQNVLDAGLLVSDLRSANDWILSFDLADGNSSYSIEGRMVDNTIGLITLILTRMS